MPPTKRNKLTHLEVLNCFTNRPRFLAVAPAILARFDRPEKVTTASPSLYSVSGFSPGMGRLRFSSFIPLSVPLSISMVHWGPVGGSVDGPDVAGEFGRFPKTSLRVMGLEGWDCEYVGFRNVNEMSPFRLASSTFAACSGVSCTPFVSMTERVAAGFRHGKRRVSEAARS